MIHNEWPHFAFHILTTKYVSLNKIYHKIHCEKLCNLGRTVYFNTIDNHSLNKIILKTDKIKLLSLKTYILIITFHSPIMGKSNKQLFHGVDYQTIQLFGHNIWLLIGCEFINTRKLSLTNKYYWNFPLNISIAI